MQEHLLSDICEAMYIHRYVRMCQFQSLILIYIDGNNKTYTYILISPGKVGHHIVYDCHCTLALTLCLCKVHDLQTLCSEVDPSSTLEDCLQCMYREGMCSKKTLAMNSRATDLYGKARFQAGVSYCLFMYLLWYCFTCTYFVCDTWSALVCQSCILASHRRWLQSVQAVTWESPANVSILTSFLKAYSHMSLNLHWMSIQIDLMRIG